MLPGSTLAQYIEAWGRRVEVLKPCYNPRSSGYCSNLYTGTVRHNCAAVWVSHAFQNMTGCADCGIIQYQVSDASVNACGHILSMDECNNEQKSALLVFGKALQVS